MMHPVRSHAAALSEPTGGSGGWYALQTAAGGGRYARGIGRPWHRRQDPPLPVRTLQAYGQ
jgi:hypothetical protein